MKTKSIALTGLTILLASTLVACSSNTTDNGGKSSTPTAKTSQNEKKKTSTKEVTNGELLKVGEWKNDTVQGKMKLVKINNINKTYTTGNYSIKLGDYKMFEVTPKSDTQKEAASTAFSSSTGVTSPYYEIQVKYTIENNSDTAVQFNGIKSLVTESGTQMDLTSGLQDLGIGAEVAAHAKKETAVMGLINTSEKDKLSKLTINFDSFANTSDFSEAAPAIEPVTLELK